MCVLLAQANISQKLDILLGRMSEAISDQSLLKCAPMLQTEGFTTLSTVYNRAKRLLVTLHWLVTVLVVGVYTSSCRQLLRSFGPRETPLGWGRQWIRNNWGKSWIRACSHCFNSNFFLFWVWLSYWHGTIIVRFDYYWLGFY